MYRQRLTLTALTLLPLAVACGNETGSGSVGPDPETAVAGTHWTIDDVTVDGTTRTAPSGAHLRIGDDGRVRGDYGCNHFTARAAFKGDRIDLGRTTSTEMACEKGAMKFEDTLARTLADGALTPRAEGDRLTLTTGDGDRVRLTREKDAPLHGTTWRVTRLGDGDTAQPLPKAARDKVRLTLDRKHGTFGGRLGCNRGGADATVRDGHITLGTPTTTKMMCDGSLMATEESLLALFDGRVAYRIDHRTLTLTSENGASVTAVAAK